MNEGAFNDKAESIPVNLRKWDVADYGTVGPDNAVWMHCEELPERDTIRLGQTKYLRFRANGASTIRVIRVA